MKMNSVLHSAPRDIVIGHDTGRTVMPLRSVVAGCAFANIMMLLLMRSIDIQIRAEASQAMVAVVADVVVYMNSRFRRSCRCVYVRR